MYGRRIDLGNKKRLAHPHQYERLSNGTSFKCVLPGCKHIMHGGIELLVGREAACPFGDHKFIITREHLRRKAVHCMECTKSGNLVKDDKVAIEVIDKEKEMETMDLATLLLKEKGIA